MAKASIVEKINKMHIKKPPMLFYYLLCIYARLKLRHLRASIVRYDHIPKKGPCFILFNHGSRIDFLYVAIAAFPRRLNFVGAYHEYFRNINHIFMHYTHAIPKKNSISDLQAIGKIKEAINNGCAVAIAPEGKNSNYGRNTPILSNTGRFLKMFNVPIYVAKINGAYLSCPKASSIERRGKVEITLKKISLNDVKDSELDNFINQELRFDDYEWQATKKIKWKHKDPMANHLERILYQCPKCGQEYKMATHDNIIECQNCHYHATTDEYYSFNDPLKQLKSPSEWVRLERKNIIKAIRENNQYSFSVKVKIGMLNPYKYTKHNKMSYLCGEGTLTIDHQGFHFIGKKNGLPHVFNVNYFNIFTVGVTQRLESIMAYVNNEFYQMFPEYNCALKIKMLVEEMQRLHSNIWPNFTWESDLYQ